MGFWGFVVTFTDGTVYRESDGPWVEMPDKGIAKVTVATPNARDIVLEGLKCYFFNNEAVARMPLGTKKGKSVSMQGELVAKLLGGIDKEGNAIEYRVTKEGKTFMRQYPSADLPYTSEILRG